MSYHEDFYYEHQFLILNTLWFCSDLSDAFWNQIALSYFSNMWNCLPLILLLMLLQLSRLVLKTHVFSFICHYVYIPQLLHELPCTYLCMNLWQDLLTKNETIVSQFLISHYEQVRVLHVLLLSMIVPINSAY